MNGRRGSLVGGVVGLLVLVTAGFAAAAIASGSSLGDILTGTTATTGTTETTGTVPGVWQRKVVICHHTHSAKHPWVTITVGAPAVPAHLRHGDSLGVCTSAQLGSSSQGHKGNNGGKGHHNSTSHGSGKGSGGRHGHDGQAGPNHNSPPDGGGSQGNGNGSGHGNAGGHGGGKP
jgi:hypothetical protein